ncbi:putative receptor-type tyrosine-protein phosphatase T isoform X2 [Apostichopus japonicus]|uniref:Putative receptor-type tyrosine-protein phosphatase T isoform X2 n=1 Tax=Stichopus japonicus TaxID=307972 RepID=A0A2G8KZI7_STIJA|nr:putative receptor-type tyrosine-protein phosphatase T isoform X2 [Apostichopus japonicus]
MIRDVCADRKVEATILHHLTLPTDQLYPCTVAGKPENKSKNRYLNILPWLQSPKKFIATQGPNEASLVDFWQMVWQENVATIVMLTSLIDGKKKHGGESRTVKHFHFTDWGDMKIPEFLDPILAFLEIVRNNTSQKKVPNTIVHCSAGVGRTGTYITLDAMLDMAQAEGKVNVYKFVTEMRQRRRQSVQVKEQYQFIFDTLVKNFCIGRTTLSVKSFGMALASLKRTNDETRRNIFNRAIQGLLLFFPLAQWSWDAFFQQIGPVSSSSLDPLGFALVQKLP